MKLKWACIVGYTLFLGYYQIEILERMIIFNIFILTIVCDTQYNTSNSIEDNSFDTVARGSRVTVEMRQYGEGFIREHDSGAAPGHAAFKRSKPVEGTAIRICFSAEPGGKGSFYRSQYAISAFAPPGEAGAFNQ